jgi:DNA-binding GntR family transcriptional regulator
VPARRPALAPLERTHLVDEVTHRLRTLILDGTLVPGRRLLQTNLAEELGVSRTPLREALRVLQNEGFVEVVDGNKTLAVVDLSQLDSARDDLAATLCRAAPVMASWHWRVSSRRTCVASPRMDTSAGDSRP